MVKVLNKCILSNLVYNLFKADNAIFPYIGILAVVMKQKFNLLNMIGRKKYVRQ